MGYFANLYVVEALAKEDSVDIETRVYGDEVGGRAYFSWISGQKAMPLFSFAQGTIAKMNHSTILTKRKY